MSFTGKWFFVSYKALIDWWGIDAIMGVWWWKIGCNWKDEITLSIPNTKLPLLWLTYQNIVSSNIYIRCYSVLIRSIVTKNHQYFQMKHSGFSILEQHLIFVFIHRLIIFFILVLHACKLCSIRKNQTPFNKLYTFHFLYAEKNLVNGRTKHKNEKKLW